MSSMYEDWMRKAFTQDGRSVDAVWKDYMPKEQKIYEYMLGEKVNEIHGTVKELANRFQMTPEYIVAFVDGFNEVLDTPYDMTTITEDSQIDIVVDFGKLYKKMVEYKAEHLYELPQWHGIFTPEERKALFLEQKKSRTIVKGAKIGRNDPCPCGSGKKYKHCCGAGH